MPLVDDRGVGSIIVFDKIDGELEQRAETPCGFLLIRDTANCYASNPCQGV